MHLLNLNCDTWGYISKYLIPKDFYAFKSVVLLMEEDYWSADQVSLLEIAVNKNCPSLARYAIRVGEDPTEYIILKSFSLNKLISLQPILYNYFNYMFRNSELLNSCILYKNNIKLIDELINVKSWIYHENDIRNLALGTIDWGTVIGDRQDRFKIFVKLVSSNRYLLPDVLTDVIDGGLVFEFHYIISLDRNLVTFHTLDDIYDNEMWNMFYLCFKYVPKLTVKYLFGSYICPADPYLIKSMTKVMIHMDVKTREIFSNIMTKYHDWLWDKGMEGGIRTITEIDNLGLKSFKPRDYLQQALKSPHPEYLKYLTYKGIEFNISDVHKAASINMKYAETIYENIMYLRSRELMFIAFICIIIMISYILAYKRDVKIEKQIISK